MKIGLVSPYDYASPGGVINHISHLARYFLKSGHQLRVLAPCSRKGVSYFGEQVIPIGRPLPIPSGGSIARQPLSPWLGSQVKKVLEQEQFDVLHIHEPLLPTLPTSAVNHSRSVTVGTFHACHSKPRAYSLARPFLNPIISRLDSRIAVSEAARQFVAKCFPGQYRIIPNGIDVERFSEDVLPKDEFCDGKLNILFVGRLEKRKGAGHLLGAYKILKKEFPNCRLIIVGPGFWLKIKYQQEIRASGLGDVVFTGYVPAGELPRYYRSADVFCAPATGGESFGIVLLEAMACGRPVVASNLEGFSSVINDGVNGLLVPPGDKNALAHTLLSLLRDGPRREELGRRARQRAEEFSWERIARLILDHYANLLDGHMDVRVGMGGN